MKKVFVTAISLQGGKGLKKLLYHPVDFELKENLSTSFPILPMIKEGMRDFNHNNIEVIAIRPEQVDAQKNYGAFLEELKEIGIEESQVKELVISGDQGKKNSIKMLLKLLDQISEDSLVYADITYNTKPMSAMVLYAMNLVEKMKDVEVEGIYYGEIPRNNNVPDFENAKLYDLTMFKYLQDLIGQMEIMGIQDIRTAIDRLID